MSWWVGEVLRKLYVNKSEALTRFSCSRYIAQRRRDRGMKNGEPVCLVRCPGCRSVTLLRLDLRDTAAIGHKVFCIPGLSYEDGLKNGIGLIIEGGRITGRMLYGIPACDCRLSETIGIS